MPAVMKEVTTNSAERRRRLRRKHLLDASAQMHLESEASSSHLGLLDGDLISEAMSESVGAGLLHPALDELEQRYGSQGAALHMREAGFEGQLMGPRALTSLANSHLTSAPSPFRGRDARVAQLKRRSSSTARNITQDEILARLGAGEPIPGDLRARLQPLLGLELGGIRLHRGGEAGLLASELGAMAFASGSDVVLADDAPDLSSQEGLFLLTHELAHVAQQARGEVQAPAGEGAILEDSALEAQADTLAAQVASHPAMDVSTSLGESPSLGPAGAASLIQPASNAPGVQMFWGDLADLAGDAWDSAAEMGGDLVDGAVNLASDAVDVVADTATAVVDTVADFSNQLWDMAASLGPKIPGYDLITVLIGHDPLAGKSVPRSASNVVKGVMGLIPGGLKLFASVQESGALQSIFTFFEGEIAKLNLTVEGLKALVSQAIDSLSMGDALDPVGALQRIGAIFAEPWKRVKAFAASVGSKIMEFIMESVLSKAGPLGAQIMGILKRAGNFVTLILKDPIPFLNNLVTAVRGGIEGFSARSPEHLQTGLVGWLTGAVKGGGIRMPGAWDMPGILGFAGDVLGLTWDFFRPRLVRLLGERRVGQLETTFDYVKALVENGISAVADIVLEAVGDIKSLVMDTIKDWTVTKVIKSAVLKLASMFNPAGALVQAVMGIYNTVAFFMERFDQIKDLASSVMDSMDNIAGGKVAEASAFIEQSIVRALPVVMGFMSRFIGLGNISKELKTILAKVRAPIERGIDKACDWIAAKAKPILDKFNIDDVEGGGKADGAGDKEEEGGDQGGSVVEKGFSMNGESHKIIVTFGAGGKVEMASKRDRLSVKVGRAVAAHIQSQKDSPDYQERLDALKAIGLKAKHADKESAKENPNPQIAQELATAIEAYGTQYGVNDLDGVMGGGERSAMAAVPLDVSFSKGRHSLQRFVQGGRKKDLTTLLTVEVDGNELNAAARRAVIESKKRGGKFVFNEIIWEWDLRKRGEDDYIHLYPTHSPPKAIDLSRAEAKALQDYQSNVNKGKSKEAAIDFVRQLEVKLSKDVCHMSASVVHLIGLL